MPLNYTCQFLCFSAELWANILIIAIILLLLLYYRIFFQKKKEGFIMFIRRVLILTMISGFVTYFIGYQIGNSHCNPEKIIPNILESIFSTTRLFILGNDFIEIEGDIKHNPFFHAIFSITVALASFVFISYIVHTFFKNSLSLRKIKYSKFIENHIFMGINQSTLSLSNDLQKKVNNRLVVFISDIYDKENKHLYSNLHENTLIVQRKSFLDSINLEKEEGILQTIKERINNSHIETNIQDVFHNLGKLKRKIGLVESHLYFLTDDENWNIEYAKKTINEIININQVKPVKIHIGTNSDISEIYFSEFTKLNNNQISIVVHHYASIVSRQLITEFHPIDMIEIDSETATAKTDFNVLIIGFGQIGSNTLRKFIEQGQFVGSTFHATIIDKYMNILQGRFNHLFPEIKNNYNLQFIEAEVGHSLFYSEIKKIIEKANYVVITLGNDVLNIRTALEILEINELREKKLFKILVKLENVSHWKETLKESENQISLFGESNKIFTEKNIHQSEAEQKGKAIHEAYNKLYNKNTSYDNISKHDKLSNISVAEHLYAKVKLLGYKNLDDFIKNNINNIDYKNKLSDVQKLNLSIGEHLRWNAFHFIHGWKFQAFDKISGANKEEKYLNRKNLKEKSHSCLTSWENLTLLSNIIGEDLQRADIDSIENLFNFIKIPNLENDK